MKIKKLYYSISEVSKISNLKQYVLRYWESEFSQLSPKKNNAGNRKYRKNDIDIIELIKDLLYNKKYTINGARQYLSDINKLPKAINSSSSSKKILIEMKKELINISNLIKELK